MYDESHDDDNLDRDLYIWLAGGQIASPALPKRLFTTHEEESYRPKALPLKKPKLDPYGNEIEDDGYRNPGGGSGRPLSTDRASKSISIRVTPSQHKKFIALGGCKWIKQIIDETSQ